MSRTFAMLKPDALERHLVGTILTRIEQAGFRIQAIQTVKATKEQLATHYQHIADKPFFNELVSYMQRQPLIVMVLEADNAVFKWRKLMGATNPDEASVGTIRGDYGLSPTDNMENLVHGSDSDENAEKEITIWMKTL